MAHDEPSPLETSGKHRSLHAALSTAIAGFSGVYERLGQFADTLSNGRDEVADSGALRDDPNRETWADVHEVIADGTVVAAFATGLHHQAAAQLDAIEHEIASISALVRKNAA